ncbi:MAG: CvpA family protein [Lachnospiraceae bacterium]|nr:CvpA family protein [Lachnospiraceae bacterium]
MNWICIIIGVVFFACVIAGWIQGLFKVLVSVAGLIASIMIAIYVAPNISGYVQQHTTLDDELATFIIEKMELSNDTEDVSRGVQVELINELAVPDALKENMLNNNNSEVYSLLEASGVNEYIAKSMAMVIINAVVFLVLVAVCNVFFSTLGKGVDKMTKLPIIRSIDKIGGGLLGGMRGLLVVWMLFLVLSITSTTETSQELIQAICQSGLLKLLYDNNLLLDIVGDLTRVLFL